ncbi:MAG: signal recognition particle receptor subunit alpha [Nanoarchaeota archaeon]
MVLDKLGQSLKDTLKKISSSLFVDEKLVNELVRDLQRALLQADVNVKLVFNLTNAIKTRFKDEETPGGISQRDHLVHILYEELARFLGGDAKPIDTNAAHPYTIMLVGLFGNGKTTTAGKLAKYYQKRGKKLALLSTDTWRPAAFEQLKQLGAKVGVDVYGDPEVKDPVEIYKTFEDDLAAYDMVIVDTAGRDALNDELVQEISDLRKAVDAQSVFLVMSADIGQAAQRQAETFHETCNVTGVIITKMDGTAKGGAALAACSVTGAPVRFIGVGEKIDDFEEFRPKNFVGRLLGMGDLDALLEKTQDAFNDEEVMDLSKRLLKGEFTLIDLYEQMKAIKKMGPISKVMELVPGFSNMQIPKEALSAQEEKMKVWRYVMDSCTKRELEEPSTISGGRISRIAQGSGTSEQDVRDLVKQHRQAKKMMKAMKGMSGGGDEKKMQKMMKRMGGMKGLFGGKL